MKKIFFLLTFACICSSFAVELENQTLKPLPQCTANISRFKEVHPFLFRGAQPENYADLECLKNTGIKTIINLIDKPKELIYFEKTLAKALDINYFSFPTSGILPPEDEHIQAILKELIKKENQPVFIHCHYGKDRTGLIVGLYRVWYDHWEPGQAWEEMLSFGFNKYFLGLSYYFWSKAAGIKPNE
ncbi:MAG: tyrosine-protein phosphatase [Bdellovibrio sp.]|nr:tyrosine-protein phosphatase [Bdellovibrio sp.]